MPQLRFYDSLTRALQPFEPVAAGEARVYTCGPTVYNYPHLGNMRAYVFADTLGRVLSSQGYALRHVINITDVGHLTDDADAGEDKLERAARTNAQSIWDIAKHYTEAFLVDVGALNIRAPHEWSVATDYVPRMIAFAQSIAERHCYLLPDGLYFDTSSVADYGRLARAPTDDGAGEGRIAPVAGKRYPADFAIWRLTPPGETRQMEWDSPWGRGAPGWHLECSVMSQALLGFPFDIHTGGIDHREIHHPNEIAQNQAYGCTVDSGARLWLHNNFLVDRSPGKAGEGKMSKSSGDFLRLQRLIDRGIHPLAYRLLCLQAHYRSELEFSWDGLLAALTRLKRIVLQLDALRGRATGEVVLTPAATALIERFEAAICDDLALPVALPLLEEALAIKALAPQLRLYLAERFDEVLGLRLDALTRQELRLRPSAASLAEDEIEARIAERAAARAAKDFARSDRLRDELAAHGVDLMDGDPLGWEWRLSAEELETR